MAFSNTIRSLNLGLGVGVAVAFGSWFTGSLGHMSGFALVDALALIALGAFAYACIEWLVNGIARRFR